jgi:hypothetical protein
MDVGQILLNSPMGVTIYFFCKDVQDINNVVEIGTWRGMGSTECIVRGLEDSGRENINFISLESNQEMYDIAVALWKNQSPSWLKLIHGRIVDISDMDTENLVGDEVSWLEQDKNAMNSCPDVYNLLPEVIDFLFLDGGGFTTEAEFWKLKDRSKYIFIDDTLTRKGINIRKHVLNNLDKYDILFDITDDRNGVMGIFNKNALAENKK